MADGAQRAIDSGRDALALVRARLAKDTEAARILITHCDQRVTMATLADWVAALLRQEYGDATEETLQALAQVARDG